MKISLNWLKELVEYDLTPKELANKLSLLSIGVKDVTDNYLELDLTYNRGDLLSLRGVAREVAAITNSKVTSKEIEFTKPNLPQTPAKVEDERLCPAYCLAKIEGLKVAPSAKEWLKKLEDSGMRSVNNVADITNLIMLEYGQPLHAFDADEVKGEVSVRVAKRGEELVTLDGKKRKLDSEDLLIADEAGSIGLAGVMGGKDSEVSGQTTSILLEAAIFDPTPNRNTSKRHGLYSEATKRFQHGLTKTNLLQALSAAIKKYENLGGKLTALTLAGDLEDKPKTISLNLQKINDLIGIELTILDVEQSLQSLGFHLEGVSSNLWEVTVPYWRLDTEIEEDLIEEVARIYGYDKIEGKELPKESLDSLDQTLPQSIETLKVNLKDLGLTEIQSYSFYSTAVLEALGFTKDNLNILVKIANPISSETEYLRLNLWPNLVEVLGKNLKKGQKDIAIFEIGKVFSPKVGDLPNENYKLAIALYNGTGNPLEELISFVQSSNLHLEGVNLNPASLFHPTRVTKNMAEVHLRVLNKLGIEKRVAVLEIDLINL